MTPPAPKGSVVFSRSISRPTIVDKVIRTVAAHLGLRCTELVPESHLRDDLHADLLDRIELAVTVEEQFSVRIPLEASMHAETVHDLIALLERAMDAESRTPASADSGNPTEKEEEV